MIKGMASFFRCGNENSQIPSYFFLTDIILEILWTKGLVMDLSQLSFRGDHPGRAVLKNCFLLRHGFQEDATGCCRVSMAAISGLMRQV